MIELFLSNITVPTGNQISNTSAKTYFADIVEMGANSQQAGDLWMSELWVPVSSKSSAPGTFKVGCELGGVDLGNLTLNLPLSLSGHLLLVRSWLRIETASATGKVRCGLMLEQWDATEAVGGLATCPNGTGATGQTTVDLTAATALRFYGQFSLADSANVATLVHAQITRGRI